MDRQANRHKVPRRSISSLPVDVWEDAGRFARARNTTRNAIIVQLLTKFVRQERSAEALTAVLAERKRSNG